MGESRPTAADVYSARSVTYDANNRSAPYTFGMLIWFATALAVWWVLAPESARRAGIALYRPLEQTIDPPRAFFIRLGGLTWLFILAWDTWMARR